MANPNVGTYDSKRVIVNYGGDIIDGFAEGTFIEVTPNDGDGFEKKVGADGEVQRSKSADNTHNVKIVLLQSSRSNQMLSTNRETDKQTGKAMRELTITDENGEGLHFWPQAWIRGDPTWGYAKRAGEREWILDTGQQGKINRGGIMES